MLHTFKVVCTDFSYLHVNTEGKQRKGKVSVLILLTNHQNTPNEFSYTSR